MKAKETYDWKRVQETRDELDAWKAKHDGRLPSVYRHECRHCGYRYWGSGIAVGAHRNRCTGKR